MKKLRWSGWDYSEYHMHKLQPNRRFEIDVLPAALRASVDASQPERYTSLPGCGDKRHT